MTYNVRKAEPHWCPSPPDVGVVNLLIAPLGADTSTYCRDREADLGTVLSLDDARARLGLHAHDTTVTSQAMSAVQEELVDSLLTGGTVTVHVTSCDDTYDKFREYWLRLAQHYRAQVNAIVLRVRLETCLARNEQQDPDARHDRHVPADVVIRTWRQINNLTADSLKAEGFADVHEIALATGGR